MAIQETIKILEEKIARLANMLVTGGASSFAEYSRFVGEADGYRTAITEFKQQMIEEETADD